MDRHEEEGPIVLARGGEDLAKHKLTFRKYPAIHTNYIISDCQTQANI